MDTVTSLSLGRIAVGISALATPALAETTLASPTSNRLITQWFGSREIALGVATLLSSGSARRNLVLIGAAVDAADAGTAYLAVSEDRLPKAQGLGLVGIAAGAMVSGLLGLRVKRKPTVELA